MSAFNHHKNIVVVIIRPVIIVAVVIIINRLFLGYPRYFNSTKNNVM